MTRKSKLGDETIRVEVAASVADMEKAAQRRWAKRLMDMPPTVEMKGGAVAPDLSGKATSEGWVARFADTCGTSSLDFANRILSDVSRIAPERGNTADKPDVDAALAIIHGVRPANEIEAMLAAQMAGTHILSMEMMRKARHTDNAVMLDSYNNMAVKLMRTFTGQAEALAKLRRGGEQTVRVEHVHVYDGGQAIVGHVENRGGGADRRCDQPRASIAPEALAYVPGVPMWCEDEGRDTMPVAGGTGKGPVSDARRSKGKRRAEG